MKWNYLTAENKAIVKRIVSQILERMGIFAEVTIDTKEIRSQEYVTVRSANFQTQPVIYKHVYIYGDGRIGEDTEKEHFYHLPISIGYGFKYFSGAENGVTIGTINILIYHDENRQWVEYGGIRYEINTSPLYKED